MFVKSKIEGMSHKEIAQEMQIAVKPLKTRLPKPLN
ncbi:MAG: hypothetical protein IPP37_13840 [Saprospiraceae bacterium]|nr:hypothetical protein [Saprospiraceae bacterium]